MSNSTFTTYRHLKLENQQHVPQHVKEEKNHHPFLRPVTFKISVNYHTNQMYFSWAQCSPYDNFSRAEGRRVADKRFKEGYGIASDYDSSLSLVENCVRNICVMLSLHDEESPRLTPEMRKAMFNIIQSAFYIGIFNKNEALSRSTRWERIKTKLKNRKLFNDFGFIADYFPLSEIA